MNIEYEADNEWDEDADDCVEDDEIEEDDFLADFGADRFVSAPAPATERDLAKQAKAEAREMKAMMMQAERDAKRNAREYKAAAKERAAEAKRAAKRAEKGEPAADDDELFSDNATPIVGKAKIVLLKKVKQYKTLFPDELKKFKIKRNPTEKDLADALTEMEVLVETSGIDGFLLDGVLQSIKLIEGASSYTTSYDIRGCADMLKGNKQFGSLMRQLFIKYNVFSAVPAEYQLLMLVSTTAYICTQKNKNRSQINAYLNEPMAA